MVSLKCPILNLSFIRWRRGLISAGWVNHTNPALLWWIHFHPSDWMGASLAKASFRCWDCVGNSLHGRLEKSPIPPRRQIKRRIGWTSKKKNGSRCGFDPYFGWERPGYVSQRGCIYSYSAVVTVWIFEVVLQTQIKTHLSPRTIIGCRWAQLWRFHPSFCTISWGRWLNVRQMLQSSS